MEKVFVPSPQRRVERRFEKLRIAKSASIAAASILAKVTRDRMCLEQDTMYPEYNIKKHKGYPTKEHMDAVRKYGPSPIHRKTFLKFLDTEG